MRFMSSRALINNISPIQQTPIITCNNNILLDFTNNCKYCFDELFSDIKSFCRSSVWKTLEDNMNFTINKKVLSRAMVPRIHKRYNKFYLTLHDKPPFRVYHIMRIIQALKIKSMTDHVYLEDVFITKKNKKYDVVKIFCGS